jgi:hypothetical protein
MMERYRETFDIPDPNEFDTTLFHSVVSLYSFNMDHVIESGAQYICPRDSYNFEAFVFAVESATNKSVPVLAFEIGTFGSGDFASRSEVTTSTSWFYDGLTTMEVESNTLFASIRRSVAAQALTYSMFAINWVLAISSILTTSVAFQWGEGAGNFGITLLPVTLILTIPAIRNIYVGSPPFGIFLGT